MMRRVAIDLFAGAGGLSLGLHSAGFDVVAALDSWQLAVDTYTKNLPHAASCLDVAAVTGDEVLNLAGIEAGAVDLVAGGPPCQGFSVQRIGADTDPRNKLVLDFARLVADIKPRAFLMENVPGLLGKRGAAVFERFTAQLTNAGYSITVQRINASDFGVPQNRRRVLVAGWRIRDRPLEVNPPSLVGPATVWDAIGDLPPAAAPGATAPADPLHIESNMSDVNRERLALIPPGGGFEDLPLELRVRCHLPGAAVIGHRGVYGRLAPDRPAGTITARFDSFTRGRFAHPYENRNITLREGARLQTFPDDFEFLGNREEIAAQVGNAVAPRLAASVAVLIKQQLDALE